MIVSSENHVDHGGQDAEGKDADARRGIGRPLARAHAKDGGELRRKERQRAGQQPGGDPRPYQRQGERDTHVAQVALAAVAGKHGFDGHVRAVCDGCAQKRDVIHHVECGDGRPAPKLHQQMVHRDHGDELIEIHERGGKARACRSADDPPVHLHPGEAQGAAAFYDVPTGDAQHDDGAHHRGVDRTPDPQAQFHDEHIAEDRVQNAGDRHGQGRRLGAVVGVDKVEERPLAEHDGHENELRPDVRARQGVRRIGAEQTHELRKKHEAQGGGDDVDRQQQPQDRMKDAVALLLASLGESRGVVDGTADGKTVAQYVVKQIYRLTKADGCQAPRADAVSDEHAVHHARHRHPKAAEQRWNEKAPKCATDKIAAPLLMYLFRSGCHLLSPLSIRFRAL